MNININDITQGVDKNKLNETLKRFSTMISKNDMNQVMNTLKNTNQNELKQQLDKININDLSRVLSSNPALKNALGSNPEIIKNLNSILSDKK